MSPSTDPAATAPLVFSRRACLVGSLGIGAATVIGGVSSSAAASNDPLTSATALGSGRAVTLLNTAHWSVDGADLAKLGSLLAVGRLGIDRIVPGSQQQRAAFAQLRSDGHTIGAIIAARGDCEDTVVRRISAVIQDDIPVWGFCVDDADGHGARRLDWARSLLADSPRHSALPLERGRLFAAEARGPSGEATLAKWILVDRAVISDGTPRTSRGAGLGLAKRRKHEGIRF